MILFPRSASSRQTFHMINTCEGAPQRGKAMIFPACACLLRASRHASARPRALVAFDMGIQK